MDSPSPLSGETGAVGPGPRERPVVQAGAGALSTAGSPCPALPAASRTCTFPVPTGGHAGSHPASPAWGTWETSIPPSNLMRPLPEAAPPLPGYGHLTSLPSDHPAGGRRPGAGAATRRCAARASPALAAARPAAVSVGAGAGRLGPPHLALQLQGLRHLPCRRAALLDSGVLRGASEDERGPGSDAPGGQ